MTVHDLTLTRDEPWGLVAAWCSVCGFVGRFHTVVAAYERHPRHGPAAHTPASYCRGS